MMRKNTLTTMRVVKPKVYRVNINHLRKVKSAILSAVPGCEVVKNVDIVPKTGAFEVSHQGKVRTLN
jgi:hypothetical protein